MSESLNKYQLIWWRPIYDIGFCYLIIGLCIYFSYLCPASYVFLIFIIANRQLALSLICHEALHENLFKNKKLNNFVGRWLCAFPTWISFSKYKKLHLLHHSGLGLSHDPDRHLYQQYPVTWKNYLQDQAKSLIQFKTMVRFLKYYTELLDLKSYYSKKDIKTFFKRLMAGDFIYFLIFKCTLLFVLIKRDLYIEYLLFFMCPILFIVQPYVWFMAYNMAHKRRIKKNIF